jgi:EAL domain-containing protein (putative c-di-GMP-specific phosphodiesterase class I)
VDPVRRALAASLVTFAAETGAQIVAEGVETEDELVVLRQLGLRYAQGYYLARPATLETLAIAQRRPA